MNFFKFFIGDYQRDTGTLSLAEHGAYSLMLQYYYATEKPLPKDKRLYRLLRATTKTERDAIDAVAREFWTETDAGWVNARADAEIEASTKQRDVNRELGKRGGRPKNKTESVSETEPNGNRIGSKNKTESVSETEPNGNPSHSQTTTSSSLRSEEDAAGEGVGETSRETQSDTESKPKPTARATRLETDWVLPDAWRQWAEAERPELDADRAAATFADYWHAKAGKDGRKLDWLATWRNWVRNEKAPASAPRRMNPAFQSFRMQDREADMQRWEEMTGRRHPDRDKPAVNVIEIQAKEVRHAIAQ